MAAAIRLEWQRDSHGYDIVERPAEGNTLLTEKPARLVIAPRGGAPERYSLKGLDDRVFEHLANTPSTPDGVLSFVDGWGLLDELGEHEVQGFYGRIRELYELIKLARDFRLIQQPQMLERAMNEKGVGPMNLRFGRLRGDSTPSLFFQPRSLWLFCCAEVMQVVAGGGEIRDCANCGAFFTIGLDPGVRSTRTYCSNRCRMTMHRRERRRGATSNMP
jgi:hypothetical protein